MLFWSWEVWHILPNYEQILAITKFVSSKFLAEIKRNRQLNIQRYTDINHTVSTNTDTHYSKTLPSTIYYEKLSPYFVF
jgi:hypothetical protein